MRLCSVNDVKLFMDKEDDNHNALLDKLVQFTSQLMENAMHGRLLRKEQRSQYFDAGGKIFLLPAFPVDLSPGFTVTVDGTVQVRGDDYQVDTEKGFVEFSMDTNKTDPLGVNVTWTGGFTEATGTGILSVPDDLEFACIIQSSFLFRRRKDIGTSYILMPDGAASIPVKEGLLPIVQDVVNRYSLSHA